MIKSSFMILALLFILITLFLPAKAYAIVDPLSVPNNKFGIHIIQATPDESSPAASLVNHNGDWGYITVLIESKDRNHDKWQEFFNDLRRRHLIPLVRLATQPQDSLWKRPYEEEHQAWADFLDSLVWPTKNRYVIIYNEPNQAKEWGGAVDAKDYAQVLNKTITALKTKNTDFFVLNAGFDASAPNQMPNYEDEITFLQQINQEVPGIFNKLDGWVSHSYPNPGFVGSPEAFGRGTVRTWYWELQQLRSLGVNKNLPVFITETGWKHAEGLYYDLRLPSADIVAKYYKRALETTWNNERIVAVTPFLLNYQEIPFDHFSFKKITGEKQAEQFYSLYQTIQNLPKVSGKPIQDNLAKLTQGEVYSSIVSGESYTISLTFKNMGESIWNDRDPVNLVPLEGGKSLGIESVELPKDRKIEPGQEYTFNIKLKAPQSGIFKVGLNLFEGQTQFSSKPLEFTTEVKSPVILRIKSALGWKKDASGEYILKLRGAIGENSQTITLDKTGFSDEVETKYLLPDYSFDFTLTKPFYLSKTIHQTVYAGVNLLDFETLKPDIMSALLHPKQLWELLPFSN